jgi:hypothetical protein
MSVLRFPLFLSLCGLLLLHALPVSADEDASDGSAADVLDDVTDTTDEPDTDTTSDAVDGSGADVVDTTDGSADSDGSAAPIGPLTSQLRTVVRLRRFTGQLPPVTVRVQGAVDGAAEGSSGQELVVDELAAGLYDVTWEASGFEPAGSSVQVPRADVVTVTLYPDLPSSLAGRIVAPDADVSRTALTLTGLSEMLRVEPVRTATVNADGTFQIPDLRAGVYRLDAVNGTLTARLDRLEIIGPVDLQVRLVDSEDFPGVTVSGGCAASGRESAPWSTVLMGFAAVLLIRARRRHPVEVR